MILKEFVKERNEAFKSLDMTKIKDFANKYDIRFPDNQLAFWAGVHKARLQIIDISEQEKKKSIDWLLENGFKTEISYE